MFLKVSRYSNVCRGSSAARFCVEIQGTDNSAELGDRVTLEMEQRELRKRKIKGSFPEEKGMSRGSQS